MQFLVHYPSYYLPPEGIWWLLEDGSPASYYAPGSGALEHLGTAALSGVSGQPLWDQRVDRLTSTTPITDGWEAVDVDDATMSPEAVLRMLRRVVPT